jgi:hypothetical protein
MFFNCIEMKITAIFRFLLYGLLFLVARPLVAQTVRFSETLLWPTEKNDSIRTIPFEPKEWLSYDHQSRPLFNKRYPLNAQPTSVQLVRSSESLLFSNDFLAGLSDTIVFEWYGIKEKGKWVLVIDLLPYRLNENGQTLQLNKFELLVETTSQAVSQSKLNKTNRVKKSVLSEGEVYRLKIGSDGIYKIDHDFIQQIGLNPSEILWQQVQLFGNGGGILPEVIAEDRPDDLQECAIKIQDLNNNGRWDEGDYFLFYGKGPHPWVYLENDNRYHRELNIYDDFSYYFMRFGKEDGKRIQNRTSGTTTPSVFTADTYDHLIARERDERALTRSGRVWVGDEFNNNQPKTFSHTIPSFKAGEEYLFTATLLARSLQNSSMQVLANNDLIHNQSFFSVSGEYTADFSTPPLTSTVRFTPSVSQIDLLFRYTRPLSSSLAWIDRYLIQGKVNLNKGNGQLRFSNHESMSHSISRFEVTGNITEIWDVTEPNDPFIQLCDINGNEHIFHAETADRLRWYFALGDETHPIPEFDRKIEAQNLHGIERADYIIVAAPSLFEQAERLAEFHRSEHGFQVVVVSPFQIYNEFSSGAQDVTAIRDFIKMVYDRSTEAGDALDHVLMFGDASYDFKDRLNGNTNLVPVFQSINSQSPTISHCSDDYFAILDDEEGFWPQGSKEGLDIGIGRLPAKSNFEASVLVDKIISYHRPETMGDWRNRLVFVADDEDNNAFVNDCEDVSNIVYADHPEYNVQKIYMDAYPQQSFGSGDKYPDVNQAIDDALERGVLIFNYIGHGGGQGLAHERIITREQIQSWDNADKLPLFVTATCELSRFDDPSQNSPGELILLNPNGGAIALVTTTRVVYTNTNKNLNIALFNKNLLDMPNGTIPALGDVYRLTKNNSQRDVNQRNFILLGDPALTLAYPRENIVATRINGKVPGQEMDTLKALGKVRIEGAVLDENGQVNTGFNGVITPTVFDKMMTYETLENDPASFRQQYEMQTSALYRGNVSVRNGRFGIEFVVPKDITYNYGEGKLSFYGRNEQMDGHGLNTEFLIGGTSDSAGVDRTGPELDLFLNDSSWVNGGITNNDPLLYARVRDENGINMVGTGIGREITAILDKGQENEQLIVLNDYYQSALDDYQQGEIRYQFDELAVGNHTLHLKIWDVYNNSSEAYTEFVVKADEKPVIENVFNYPNPFTTNTVFHFDHNQSGRNVRVKLSILTISGRDIYSEVQEIPAANSHISSFSWNGLDRYGDQLARGVYIYKIELQNEEGDKSQVLQKLFLMR